ncbi:MAG TPA: DinB family protein [Fimbriimonadaceae bacterium]|nr:DinB family protein [Fimbriimonadaceae bacterium]
MSPFVALDFPSPEIGLFASCLQDATNEWREELGEVDPDTIVWQPFPNGHSIGALILHNADVEAWWIEEVVAGKKRPDGEERLLMSEETKQYGVEWPAPPRQPLSWYFGIADRIRASTLETLREIDDPDRIIQREDWSSPLNVRWIVNHVVGHEAYHGGQIVLVSLLKQKMG